MPVEHPTQQSFVVVDLEGAERADGVVRWAKKILVDGARNLARSRTYGWATLGERISGASAGISAVPEERDPAIAAFVATAVTSAHRLALDAAKGVTPDELADLAAADWHGPVVSGPEAAQHRLTLTAAGVVAAARTAAGDLDGCTVAVEGPPPVVAALTEAFRHAGAAIANPEDHSPAAAAAAEARILCCGSTVGMVDHDSIASLGAEWLVPWGPLPVTTRAVAVGRRTGTTVLPDFVTTLGPLLGALAPGDEDIDAVAERTRSTVAGVLEEVLDHEEGPLVGACLRAEAFLATWQETLPFGRPIA